MIEEKLDAILKLVSAMHSDIIELKTLKTDFAELKNEVSELNKRTENNSKQIDKLISHAIQTDKKIDKLVGHAVQTDKNFQLLGKQSDRIEKQGFAIGIELKEENKTLDNRVTKLENEVFPEITH